jgi:MFS family permease
MSFYLLLVMQVFNHTCFKGSKILLTLFALHLGATPFTAGAIFAMYSVFPALLSVFAGKLSDRIGYRIPMLVGTIGISLGMLVPYLLPSMTGLFITATLCGTCYIFYTVAVQHLVGSIGDGLARTRNYSWYALCVGLTALIGPVLVGFSIEGLGHTDTYLLMATLPLIPLIILLGFVRYLPVGRRSGGYNANHRIMDLLRMAALRRALLTGGIIETGNELGNFLLPIYVESIGLPPSQIGLVVGALAAALMIVRSLIPVLVRHSCEETVLGRSLFVAAGACLMFPFVDTFVPLLLVAFVMGLGIGCGAPLSMVIIYNRTPEGRSGEALGLRHTVNKATEAAIPLVFGSIATAFSMLPVFAMVAAMLAAGGGLMTRDTRHAHAR